MVGLGCVGSGSTSPNAMVGLGCVRLGLYESEHKGGLGQVGPVGGGLQVQM